MMHKKKKKRKYKPNVFVVIEDGGKDSYGDGRVYLISTKNMVDIKTFYDLDEHNLELYGTTIKNNFYLLFKDWLFIELFKSKSILIDIHFDLYDKKMVVEYKNLDKIEVQIPEELTDISTFTKFVKEVLEKMKRLVREVDKKTKRVVIEV